MNGADAWWPAYARIPELPRFFFLREGREGPQATPGGVIATLTTQRNGDVDNLPAGVSL